MLGIYLSPIYIIIHIFMLRWLLKWLKNVSRIFKNHLVQFLVIVVYAVFFGSVGIGFVMPKGTFYERLFKKMGNYALGISLYEFLVLLVFGIIRFFRRHRRFADLEKLNSRRHIAGWGLVAVLLISSICGYSIYHAHHIENTSYDVIIKKDGRRFTKMNIVLASDLHLGFNAGVAQVHQMVQKINAVHPDIVVLAGDIFDNEYRALEHPETLVRELKGIRTRYGVYAVYGNHDVEENIFSGFTFNNRKNRHPSHAMKSFLKRAHIKALSDRAVLINHSVYLYGRKDAMVTHRKKPSALFKGMNMNRPIIVADHEPRQLSSLANAGADLDLSGHTHNGQMFPANIIVSAMWPNSYGYQRIGSMDSIVTSGVGAWGPFMRLGTKAEICTIHVHFQ